MGGSGQKTLLCFICQPRCADLRQWCHHSCNLASLHIPPFWFHWNLSPPYETDCVCVYIHIYKRWAIPAHFLSVGSVIFHTVEGSGTVRQEEREGQGGEDKHVQRALLCLILYWLSSLGPSKNWVIKGPNHWGTYYFHPPWICYTIDPCNSRSSCTYGPSEA